MDQQSLLQQARRGDLPAFNRLVMAHQALVYSQALWLLADPCQAEAAAQAAILLAYRNVRSCPSGQLKLWLLRLVTDLCLGELARQPGDAPEQSDGRWPQMTPDGATNGLDGPGFRPREAPAGSGQGDVVRGALRRLPSDLRAAAVLVDIQGLNYDEAAAVLHIAVDALARRLARARLELGRDLKRVAV